MFKLYNIRTKEEFITDSFKECMKKLTGPNKWVLLRSSKFYSGSFEIDTQKPDWAKDILNVIACGERLVYGVEVVNIDL